MESDFSLSISGERKRGGTFDSEFQSHSLHKGKADYKRLNFFMLVLSSLADAVGHKKGEKKSSRWIGAWIPCWSARVEIKPQASVDGLREGWLWALQMWMNEWGALNKSQKERPDRKRMEPTVSGCHFGFLQALKKFKFKSSFYSEKTFFCH